jgi:hypothetical protein
MLEVKKSWRWPPPDKLTIRRLVGFFFFGTLFGGLLGAGTYQSLTGEAQWPSLRGLLIPIAMVGALVLAIACSCGRVLGVLVGAAIGAIVGAVLGTVAWLAMMAWVTAIVWASQGHEKYWVVGTGLASGIGLGLLIWVIDRAIACRVTAGAQEIGKAPGHLTERPN